MRSSDRSRYPDWPSSPIIEAEFIAIGEQMQRCLDQLEQSRRTLAAIDRRLRSLQHAYAFAGLYGAEGMPVAPLTPREQEILILVARGLRNEQIGQELHLSTFTVRTHMTSILFKLSARNRSEAVARAQTFGLI